MCVPPAATHAARAPRLSEKYQVVKGDSLCGLAERFYRDGSLYPAISDYILLGQMLEIPNVTFRHRVAAGDTKKKLAVHYYHDETMSEVFEIPNGVAQRDLIVGEWLVIPDLANPGHHTVAIGETWEQLPTAGTARHICGGSLRSPITW
jgi:LysM repeat protein